MGTTARIWFAERRALDRLPQENHLIYVVNYPICQIEPSGQLVTVKNYASWGEITDITIDDNQRFVIQSTSGHTLKLGAKKIVRYDTTEASDGSVTALLKQNGYLPPVTAALPVTDQFRQQLAAVFPKVKALTTIPERYAVIDCEFGILFGVQRQGDNVVQRRVSILGEKASIFQLAVLGYAGNQPIDLFFNRYLDHPNFSPTLKLRGLKETQLPLATYEAQADPLAVLKAFIQEVIARRIPLVFWDKSNDLRLLRQTLAVHFAEFSTAEQALLGRELVVFDGSVYTNLVINRSNHARKNAHHYLPLNGVAGLLNIFNPHQHNALWDAQTTHCVVDALTKIRRTQPVVLTQPQPLPTHRREELLTTTLAPRPMAHVVPDAATFCQLRSTGQTYREIAQQFGVSTSTVWRAVQQASKV